MRNTVGPSRLEIGALSLTRAKMRSLESGTPVVTISSPLSHLPALWQLPEYSKKKVYLARSYCLVHPQKASGFVLSLHCHGSLESVEYLLFGYPACPTKPLKAYGHLLSFRQDVVLRHLCISKADTSRRGWRWKDQATESRRIQRQ